MSTDVGQLAWAQAMEQMTGNWVQADNMAQQRGSAQHHAGYRSGYKQAVQDLQLQMNKLQSDLDQAKADSLFHSLVVKSMREELIQARGQKWVNEMLPLLRRTPTQAYKDYLEGRGYKVDLSKSR